MHVQLYYQVVLYVHFKYVLIVLNIKERIYHKKVFLYSKESQIVQETPKYADIYVT